MQPPPTARAEGGVRAIGMHGTRERPPSPRRPPPCNGGKKKCVPPAQGETEQGKKSLEGESYRGEGVLAAGHVLVRSRNLSGNDRGNCLKRGRILPCALRAAAQCTPCIAGCESRHGVTHEDPPLRNRARLRARAEINPRVTLTKVPWAVKAGGKAQIHRKQT